MDLSALRNVKLKKTETKSSSPNTADILKNEQEQNKRLRDCDIEAWYEQLKNYTFKTVFVEFTVAEAEEIVKRYRKEKHDEEAILGLERKIDEALKSFGGKGVFVKLSSRSPKDSTMCQNRAFSMITERIKAHGSPVSPNFVSETIMAATIESLELKTAQEIVLCLLTSERVVEDDIPLALSFPKQWSQHIVLREFVTMPISHEFRAFVFDRKLTALCQYYIGARFESIFREKQLIEDIVKKCFNEIKDICPLDPPEYSMDIGVDIKEKKAWIIELNPFGKPDGLGTGTVLFSNKKKEDLEILFGERDFEFRIQEDESQTIALKGKLADWMQEQRIDIIAHK